MSLENLLDIFASESLLPEPPLDVIQNLCVIGIGFIQQVPERQIGRPQTVTEVLGENPATVCRGPQRH